MMKVKPKSWQSWDITDRVQRFAECPELFVESKDYDTLHEAFKLAMKELHIARKFIDKCKEMVKEDDSTTIMAALDETISDRDGLQ